MNFLDWLFRDNSSKEKTEVSSVDSKPIQEMYFVRLEFLEFVTEYFSLMGLSEQDTINNLNKLKFNNFSYVCELLEGICGTFYREKQKIKKNFSVLPLNKLQQFVLYQKQFPEFCNIMELGAFNNFVFIVDEKKFEVVFGLMSNTRCFKTSKDVYDEFCYIQTGYFSIKLSRLYQIP